jgi:hypothetical protein
MAVEFGVVLAALMGAAAALMGGVLAQRYQYLLEKQKEHFAVLRDQVLAPWKRAIESRRSNLEGRDPYVVVDYVAKDYRSSPAVSFGTGADLPWSETSRLAASSKRHWPHLWATWEGLNQELAALGHRVVGQLRRIESEFPALPPGKAWANYPDDPATATKIAVVNVWATHAQLFERRTYPDWVVGQLTQHGFWRGEGDDEEKRAFAQKVVAVLDRHAGDIAKLEADAEALSARFQELTGKVDDVIHTERMPGSCDYCPKFLR